MKKLLAIGEALIDMIPSNTGRIMDVEGFQPKVGGNHSAFSTVECMRSIYRIRWRKRYDYHAWQGCLW